MFLLIRKQKGERAAEPPSSIEQEGNHHCQRHGNADLLVEEHHHQADYKGNTASDISPSIAKRGDTVHTLIVSDVNQHCIVENVSAVKTYLGGYDQTEKNRNGRGISQRGAGSNAQTHKNGKQRLLKSLEIGHGAEDGAKDRYQQSGQGERVAVNGGRIIGVHMACNRTLEVDGNDGCHQQHEGRVTDIVPNPFFLN